MLQDLASPDTDPWNKIISFICSVKSRDQHERKLNVWKFITPAKLKSVSAHIYLFIFICPCESKAPKEQNS